MILVRTELRASSIHGIGCFAAERIPRGTPVWRFQAGFDQTYPPDYPASLSAAAREQFLTYAFVSHHDGCWVYCADHARHFNHSAQPNVGNEPRAGEREGVDVALRDIAAGEELTYDYGVFAEPPPKF